MIATLISATVLPRICAALVVVCLTQFGVIACMSSTADTLRKESGATVAKLELANGAIAGYKRDVEEAAKRAEVAEKAAKQAKATARSRVNAVRAVPASGDACKDAREMMRAYRRTP